jgi:hypothetical protein
VRLVCIDMRRVSCFVVATAALLAFAAVPGLAAAQDNSAIDEYTENVPGAGGDRPTRDVDGGSGEGSGSTLPPASSGALATEGADGAAAADLAQATAPAREPGGSDGAGDGSTTRDRAGADGGLPSVGDVVAGVGGGSDSDGLGIVLPIILGSVLVGALLFLLARRRRQGEPGSA